MTAGDIETFHRGGTWFNRTVGQSRTLGAGFESREDAVHVGRSAAAARQVAHVVRDEDGPGDDRGVSGMHPREAAL
ncbi:DUF2188 domain-containing protein [Microbacterium tumbae]